MIEIIEDGIIEEGLYCRPLQLEYEGQSDYLRSHSEFSGAPMNNLKWLPVEYMLGSPWKGKTIKEYEEQAPWDTTGLYEWAVGNIPESHILKIDHYDKWFEM